MSEDRCNKCGGLMSSVGCSHCKNVAQWQDGINYMPPTPKQKEPATMRSAWLVENDERDLEGPKYLSFSTDNGQFIWVVSPHEALHFSRRRDAELIAIESDRACSIVEHGFYDERLNEEAANYEPKGLRFFDKRSGRDMILVDEEDESHGGWICYKHPDGHWVSLRRATNFDRDILRNAFAMIIGPTPNELD